MTDAEKALLDLVCSGSTVSDYHARLAELRNAVLLERLGPNGKEVWQAAYRACRTARIRLDEVSKRLGLDGVPLTPWRKEVDDQYPDPSSL